MAHRRGWPPSTLESRRPPGGRVRARRGAGAERVSPIHARRSGVTSIALRRGRRYRVTPRQSTLGDLRACAPHDTSPEPDSRLPPRAPSRPVGRADACGAPAQIRPRHRRTRGNRVRARADHGWGGLHPDPPRRRAVAPRTPGPGLRQPLFPACTGPGAAALKSLSPDVDLIVGDVRDREESGTPSRASTPFTTSPRRSESARADIESRRARARTGSGTAVLLDALLERPVRRLVVTSSMRRLRRRAVSRHVRPFRHGRDPRPRRSGSRPVGPARGRRAARPAAHPGVEALRAGVD